MDLPPVWAAAAAAAAWGSALLAPSPGLPGGAWVATAVAAAGLGLAVWAAAGFLRSRTPIEPRHAPRALLTGGAFRVNRNPIYTGMTLVLVGWAFALGAAAALIPALLFPVIIDRRFVRGEEAALRRAFGPAAEAWFARSRRW